ncbi:phosphoglycerate kinase [Candidatus Kaiserbacteria bacterium RIFCSPHIGHO2_02_FULL_55_25]|uniref:Phosphoglycerate kinase n=1 Tax=Candidatus Kaiserbacteria bacterium RIFCSPHIGHO2_02_FULL_55_25 TaxID=1798498 RepID=A0A1F6E6E4_9BACT|nr:MAG: phosphoglycerate kinase [Candidatus Kaiserbacteria bacterium RIFCSPHIGHO2_01_FULL_55_79]OGG69269.1 MAG: phosphoglycerate kinase [Candidatus Kaiserbacteria bacterium RIFCSPHIGHO2_02_FULL_55_25]OGG77034.1 MAG: phosphoglycerate kinase [Candidatus Kaiserbacteria bacterium RIFCSPHIGHO2_12_FULL_55_13]OGG83903.1 MAG: phosphoglycerate kinase [Candidatus Kaiserbacteria bacterium RIFCSPLOWO2_01_FULL_55_25]
MKCIDEVPAGELKGKRVLVRAGLDVSLDKDGEVIDLLRIQKACPTIAYLKDAGAKVIILSHIGRDPLLTNEPVARALKKYFPVVYVADLLGPVARGAVEAMKDGEILMLENLRQYYDLEKANDEAFTDTLASFGDIYVNDAFSNSHRPHASMVGIPKLLPSYAGLLLRDEVAHLSEALDPVHPALAIIGGAKFETKDPVIRTFLTRYDHVCVVGAIANDVLRVQGHPVGRSRISDHAPERDVVENPKLISPVDVTVERLDMQARVKLPKDVEEGDKIVDIGPDTVAKLAPVIADAKFIIWNGPTGLYEDGYTSFTLAIAELITESNAKKVIGGGDTIALLQENGIAEEKLGFLSTGGGAMLEYLLKGTLPAIDALG